MTLLMVLLAMCIGILVGITRVLNGRLTMHKNAFYASSANHWVGALVLTLLLILGIFRFPENISALPPVAFLGGAIGAIYVAVNAYVLPKLGNMLAAMMIISGQLFTGILIDFWFNATSLPIGTYLITCAGALMIVAGMYLSMTPGHSKEDK